jgi:hypothetical protein
MTEWTCKQKCKTLHPFNCFWTRQERWFTISCSSVLPRVLKIQTNLLQIFS